VLRFADRRRRGVIFLYVQGMRLAATEAAAAGHGHGRGRGAAVPAPRVRRRVPRVGVPQPAHDAVGLRRGRRVSAPTPSPRLVPIQSTSTSARSFARVNRESR
jgi:hypothetical protein